MTRQESWSEYLGSMIDIASEEFRNTSEYACQQEKRGILDQWIESLYPDEKRQFYENCAVELLLDADRKAEFYYRQGMKDSVSIMRELGVLS